MKHITRSEELEITENFGHSNALAAKVPVWIPQRLVFFRKSEGWLLSDRIS
jgi:hypothetical protein